MTPDQDGGGAAAGEEADDGRRAGAPRGWAAAAACLAGLAAAALGLAGAVPTAVAGAGLGVAVGGGAWLALEWRRSARAAAGADELRRRCEELRREREELESAYSELRFEQADLVNSARLATLGSLVAGIAHELDTPLGALHSDHDTLRKALTRLQRILADERVDESELEEVRRIVRAVDGVLETSELAIERMVSLVGSLRTFGRPDAAERDRVDLNEALEDTLELAAHRLGDSVEVERDYGDLPPVGCYPAQLNQAFMNLLLNASQAVEGRGTIRLETRSAGDRVLVAVEDDGVGIPEEHRDRIFEPGFSTKGSRMGMGLGLLITRQVVDRHDGEITVESERGEGTRFTVEIPVEIPEHPDSDTEVEG